MENKGKRLFVTVGTTKFDKLIETVLLEENLYKLHSLGFNEIQFQVGSSIYTEKSHPKITIKYNKFFENFKEEIEKADLIVSHAGAGTCLDVLRCEKPLIVVINEDLMDNHQLELAEQLQADEYLYYCNCETLNVTLEKEFGRLRKYPKPNKQLFNNYLNKCMGFV